MKRLTKLQDDVNNMHIATYTALKLWLVDNDKSAMLAHYKTLEPFQQELFIGALKEVMSKSADKEFRKAAKAIPEYIKDNT